MSQQRYHIHVCLVKNEQPDFENALQIATANDYFLTWDLQGTPPQKTHFSRQQIDKCDYVLFVLGDEYGELSPSGVGYLHLNYVYAMTKRKPLFAVIKSPATTKNHQRQRLDFAQLIQKDQATYCSEYRHHSDAMRHIMAGLARLTQAFPRSAWHKTEKDQQKSNDFLFTPKPMGQTTKKALSNGVFAELEKTELTTQKLLNSEPLTIPILPSDTLSLSDTILVSYTTHAYQEGNLSELTLTHSFSWQDILNLLKEWPSTFSMEAFSRKVNETLSKLAFEEAVKVMPNAHAISRTQINTLDFNWKKTVA